MPCQFQRPEILDAHCEALVKIVSASKYPVVLTGDLNMVPDQLVGRFPSLESLQGRAPTTHSRIRGKTFRGRLDHILWSCDFTVEEEIPVRLTENLMPNETQPSDHECVAAVLKTNFL